MDTQTLSAAPLTDSHPSFCSRSPCSLWVYAERSESGAQLSSLKTLLSIGRPDTSSEHPPGLPRGHLPRDWRAAAGECKKVVAGDQVNYQLQEGCKQSGGPRQLFCQTLTAFHQYRRGILLKASCVWTGLNSWGHARVLGALRHAIPAAKLLLQSLQTPLMSTPCRKHPTHLLTVLNSKKKEKKKKKTLRRSNHSTHGYFFWITAPIFR